MKGVGCQKRMMHPAGADGLIMMSLVETLKRAKSDADMTFL